ncbi:ATP-binding protein [Streptomyces pseudogriseolus]|uniref:ATP-binding protein n=1 Tax=Streptomyces pseudogriseolus TaxID=36817 RepID=UPI003FA2F83A
MRPLASARPLSTGHPGYSETFPCEETSAATARRFVRIALATWQMDRYMDTGALLVSELVSNAVRHTNSRLIRVVVTRPDEVRFRVGVTDKAGALLPQLRLGDEMAVGGRGLLMIQKVSDRWGCDLYRWGKHVWAEVKVEERP